MNNVPSYDHLDKSKSAGEISMDMDRYVRNNPLDMAVDAMTSFMYLGRSVMDSPMDMVGDARDHPMDKIRIREVKELKLYHGHG